MKSMKKILTLLMVAALAATMATTAFAAPETPTENVDPIAVSNESVLITANTEGFGQVAFSDYDSEPEFDNEHPKQSAFVNAEVGTTIKIGAKADEGWKFVYWKNTDTNEFFSMSETIPVDVTEALNLTAVFADASLVTISANTAGEGQISVSEDGSDPVFNDEQPKQSVAVSAALGDTVILGAKADEGWKFTGWKNGETDEVYSTDETITVTVSQALYLTAVFEEDDTDIHVSGGWAFSDQAYYSISDDHKAIFDSAVANTYNGTSTFEAVQTLASQSVAGANYAFLCKETPAGSEEPTNWSILTVYVDWGGNATLTHVEAIDHMNIKTLENVPEIAPGCWTVLRTDKGVTLSHAVTDATMLSGVSYVPAAILATQVVAGTNYRILAYGTTVTAEPRRDLYVIDVYEGLDGTAEVTDISVFDIAAYTTTEIVEPVEEPIRAEHTTINCGRNSDVIINTTSKSDTVVIRIDGGTAATNETEGLTLENGTVKISKELANTLLKDGENNLNLVFSDGTLEVVIYVTGESSTITPNVDVPKTGDTASAIAVSAAVLGSLTAALFLAMKRRKGEQE